MRKAKLQMLSRFNVRRCAACPIYGPDLIEALRIVDLVEPHPGDLRGVGYLHCLNALKQDSHKPDRYWTQTKHLTALIHTPQHYVNELGDIFSRYILYLNIFVYHYVMLNWLSKPSDLKYNKFTRIRNDSLKATLVRLVSVTCLCLKQPGLYKAGCTGSFACTKNLD